MKEEESEKVVLGLLSLAALLFAGVVSAYFVGKGHGREEVTACTFRPPAARCDRVMEGWYTETNYTCQRIPGSESYAWFCVWDWPPRPSR